MLFAFFVVELARGSEMIVLGPFLRVFGLFLACFRLLEPPTPPSGEISPIRPGQCPDLQLNPAVQPSPSGFSARSAAKNAFRLFPGLIPPVKTL